MSVTTMTAEQREAVQAAIAAGEKVWMVHPDGFKFGIKFEDEQEQLRQVEARIAAGCTLAAAMR